MIFGLKDTLFLVLATFMSIVLFYSYLIQYLALANDKDISDYPLGSIIKDSNLAITIGFGVLVLVLGIITVDDIAGSGTIKNKFYNTSADRLFGGKL